MELLSLSSPYQHDGHVLREVLLQDLFVEARTHEKHTEAGSIRHAHSKRYSTCTGAVPSPVESHFVAEVFVDLVAQLSGKIEKGCSW
jgi:hypothetical protein